MRKQAGDGCVEVYLWICKGNYWRRVSKEPARPLSSITLPGDQAERILEDARRFFESQGEYVRRGVPWRRGYLFHGPPGTGKSSTVNALAGELGKEIYVVNLNALPDDAALLECVSCAPPDSILLMEDVDAALPPGGEGPGVSPAGLLNALDGVASGSGRLLVMSSNRPEMLSPALTRPGRVDERYYFGEFGQEEMCEMVKKFHPGLALDVPPQVKVLPAKLQGLLMSTRREELVAKLAEALK